MKADRVALMTAAAGAAKNAYAPYSRFAVGAALAFADGDVVIGANVENASYGLSLCAEAVAVTAAMNQGRRGGLVAIAIAGNGTGERPVMPCGRCRQLLSELARLGGTDPLVWAGEGALAVEARLSLLLPDAFGPDNLG